MHQPTGGDSTRPKVVIFHDHTDHHSHSYGAPSELDLDLYDTDEVPDSPNQQQQPYPGMSLSGLPSILDQDPQPLKAPPPSEASSQHRTHYDTSSSAGGSSSTRRLMGNRPMNPHPTIRTNFTTTMNGGEGQAPGDGGSTSPSQDDKYETLATPPGDAMFTPPTEDELVHPAFAARIRQEVSMRAEWMIGLVLFGLGLGIAIESQHPDEQFAYWLTTIGSLYVRMTACITLPLAFCQVVTCSAELLNSNKLRRAWAYTALYFLLTTFFSAWLGVACAAAFQSSFERHAPKDYRLTHAAFAFKCADGHFVELQPTGGLACTGTAVAKNTTFPHLIDISQRLGLEDAVATVSVSGYVFAIVEVFFPQNIIKDLARDNFLSALLVAVVLGISVAKSYTCGVGEIRRSRNPLFRLFTHVYLSLFAMNEWVQKLALWATVPILVGAVLTMPNVTETLSLTRYYMASVTLAGFGQCLLVVPTLFYLTVWQNPYRWLAKMLAPISYGMVLQNAFLSLSMATKAALRSREISPSVFGAVYPVLSALNRSHFAIGCPTAILYVAAFSGCAIKVTASNALLMFGLTFLGSLGDTMLPQSGMTYFLMFWRAFCRNEDTPSSVLMIATIGILIFRLSACVGTTTNLLLVRMVAHAVEREDNKLQRLVNDAFPHRDSSSIESSFPIAPPPST